jgi:hypothetical protein
MKTSTIPESIGRTIRLRHYPMTTSGANWYLVLTVVVVLLFSWPGLPIWLGLSFVVATMFLSRWKTGTKGRPYPGPGRGIP